MSKAPQSEQPNFSWIIPAVEESGTSGDEVASITKSMSSGVSPASSRALLHACTARSEVCVSLLFQIELSDNVQLESILSDSKDIENVFDAKRVFPGKGD